MKTVHIKYFDTSKLENVKHVAIYAKIFSGKSTLVTKFIKTINPSSILMINPCFEVENPRDAYYKKINPIYVHSDINQELINAILKRKELLLVLDGCSLDNLPFREFAKNNVKIISTNYVRAQAHERNVHIVPDIFDEADVVILGELYEENYKEIYDYIVHKKLHFITDLATNFREFMDICSTIHKRKAFIIFDKNNCELSYIKI